MNKKKLLPLAVLACIVALLGVLLAVLNRTDSAQTDTTIPLCSLAADDLDTLAYAGNNMEVTLLKGSDGTWRLTPIRPCRWTRPRCRALWRATPG